MTSNEQYVCLNCYAVGELNEHLRCMTCDSDSVVSTEVVKQKAASPHQRSQTYYHIVYEPFETIVNGFHADNVDEAIEYASKCTHFWSPQNIDSDGFIMEPGKSIKTTVMTLDEYKAWSASHYL